MWDANLPSNEDRKQARTFKKILFAALILLITGYFVFPFVFRYSSTVKSNLAFLNLASNPFKKYFHNPAVNYALVGARNFYLTTPDGASLGVWHTLPSELQAEAASLNTDDPYNSTVAARYRVWLQDATVFVYCHGTAGSRASQGRIQLYRMLNSLGYHVITFDYRGFGDSTGHPTSQQDVAVDALTVIDWLRGHVKGGHIFLWGHSLGTGVVSMALAKLELEHDNPIVGAVLESAFNNLLDAVRTYPPSMPYSSLPGFDFFAVEPLANQGLTLRNDEYLKNVSLPLLFLHAEDDMVVPYRLGMKLYDSVASSRKDLSTVTFVGYDKGLGYGHRKIHTDPHLSGVVTDFVQKSIERKTYNMCK